MRRTGPALVNLYKTVIMTRNLTYSKDRGRRAIPFLPGHVSFLAMFSQTDSTNLLLLDAIPFIWQCSCSNLCYSSSSFSSWKRKQGEESGELLILPWKEECKSHRGGVFTSNQKQSEATASGASWIGEPRFWGSVIRSDAQWEKYGCKAW